MEEWKKVVYQGKEYPYTISSQGRLKNNKGQILKQMDWSCGYKMYKLCDKGFSTRVLVHRLVAITFIPVDGDTSILQVNHIDGNKANNAVDNLEWMTQKENIIHASENGIHNGIAYQEVEVFFNKKLFGIYPSINSVSAATGVNPGNISEIINKNKRYSPKGFSFKKLKR